jgi:Interferon-induced 6-16 family
MLSTVWSFLHRCFSFKTAIGYGLVAVSLAFFAIPILGWTSAGVAAGSVAAAVQSTVYGGATCGLFSVLQSLGATGAWMTCGCAIGGAAIALLRATGALLTHGLVAGVAAAAIGLAC